MEDQTVWLGALRCPVCNKLYSDASNSRAKSRHISYCRKRHNSPLLHRRKACDECVRSKVRCNLVPGGCSRCASRDVPCTYQNNLNGQNVSGLALQTNDGGSTQTASLRLNGDIPVTIPALDSSEFWPGLGSLLVENGETLGNSNTFLTNLTSDNDIFRSERPCVSDLTTDFGRGYAFQPQVHPSSTVGGLQSTLDVAIHSEQTLRPHSPMPASLAYIDPSSLFERRKFSEPELELTGDLALHILRSYPYMLANQDSVPPFIHSRYQHLSENDVARPRSLDAALKLAKLLLISRPANKSLLWGLIRAEQERLFNEHLGFGKWEALEALQSHVVYILLRIIDGHHDCTNFGTRLLASINAICEYIRTRFGSLISSDECRGQMISWKDWIFLESRRRTATAVYIINSLVHAQIAAPPQTMPEYSRSPAPCPKTTWHAENEKSWQIDYTKYLRENAMHGMLEIGHLVELKETAGKQPDRWYAYADSFGLLATLAANLINQ